MSRGGFVDLRLNVEQAGDEGFWPSFTDIMTVIVLIFLLAMLMLMVKNMDLVHQLQDSLASERAASAQVRSTSDINTALNQRLKQLEEHSAMLSMRLMNLGEEHNQTQAQLRAAQQQNQDLSGQLSEVSRQRDQLASEKAVLSQGNADLAAQLSVRERELLEQQHQHQLKLDEVGRLQNSSASQLAAMQKLEQEYASLESKYKRLIRPARSSLGKVVTLVRYHKQQGALAIEIKGPADQAYRVVNGAELHQRLSALQQKYGKKLYVRIIFPDDSGLSYSEAWKLTESLLRQYDYYYQE